MRNKHIEHQKQTKLVNSRVSIIDDSMSIEKQLKRHVYPGEAFEVMGLKISHDKLMRIWANIVHAPEPELELTDVRKVVHSYFQTLPEKDFERVFELIMEQREQLEHSIRIKDGFFKSEKLMIFEAGYVAAWLTHKAQGREISQTGLSGQPIQKLVHQ